MPVSVHGDDVPRRGDLGGQPRIPVHLLSAEEEGGGRIKGGQRLEDGWRPLRVRAVIEGERDAHGIVDPARQAENAGDRRHDRGERRRPPRGRRGGRADE